MWGDYIVDEAAQCGQVVEVDAEFFDADLDQTHYLGMSVRWGRTERAGHEIEISARLRLREVGSVCGKVGVEFGDEFDFGMRSADLLAVVHQPLVGRLVDLQWPVPHPSVGLGRSDTHQLWSLAADEDRRWWAGARLAVCVAHGVVLACVACRCAGPHRPDEIDCLAELLDALAGSRERVVVCQILVLLPASADAEYEAARAECLQRGGHLRQ